MPGGFRRVEGAEPETSTANEMKPKLEEEEENGQVDGGNASRTRKWVEERGGAGANASRTRDWVDRHPPSDLPPDGELREMLVGDEMPLSIVIDPSTQRKMRENNKKRNSRSSLELMREREREKTEKRNISYSSAASSPRPPPSLRTSTFYSTLKQKKLESLLFCLFLVMVGLFLANQIQNLSSASSGSSSSSKKMSNRTSTNVLILRMLERFERFANMSNLLVEEMLGKNYSFYVDTFFKKKALKAEPAIVKNLSIFAAAKK